MIRFVITLTERVLLVTVNYANQRGQCFVRFGDFGSRFYSKTFTLLDLLSGEVYIREGNALADQGLYLDVEPWKVHVFEVFQS